MKTLLSLAIFFLSFSVSAQKLTKEKVPLAARTAFTKAHPGITPKWEKEDGNYEAVFELNGKEASCVINRKGVILETETTVSLSDLPAAANNYVKDHLKAIKIDEIAKIETASGVVNYEVVGGGKNILFDKNGKVLKSSKDKKD